MITSKNNDNITTQLVVAVVGEIANKMVDAAAMAKGSATRATSRSTASISTPTRRRSNRKAADAREIAKLLNGQPTLNVFIVGHTDSQGSFELQHDLSRQRAEAVAAALVTSLQNRARAACAPPASACLSPVGSNATEDGRALNRRVELVAP